jgi:hypothetical protein
VDPPGEKRPASPVIVLSSTVLARSPPKGPMEVESNPVPATRTPPPDISILKTQPSPSHDEVKAVAVTPMKRHFPVERLPLLPELVPTEASNALAGEMQPSSAKESRGIIAPKRQAEKKDPNPSATKKLLLVTERFQFWTLEPKSKPLTEDWPHASNTATDVDSNRADVVPDK